MKSPIKHCFSTLMHTEPWSKMRGTTAKVSGRGTGNKVALKQAKEKRNTPMEQSTPLYKKMTCWKGYVAKGKKKSPSGKRTKSGKIKMVNNCVKK